MEGSGTTERGSQTCCRECLGPGAAPSQDVQLPAEISSCRKCPVSPVQSKAHRHPAQSITSAWLLSHSEPWLENLGSCLDNTSLISESHWAKTSQKLILWQDPLLDRGKSCRIHGNFCRADGGKHGVNGP